MHHRFRSINGKQATTQTRSDSGATNSESNHATNHDPHPLPRPPLTTAQNHGTAHDAATPVAMTSPKTNASATSARASTAQTKAAPPAGGAVNALAPSTTPGRGAVPRPSRRETSRQLLID